MNTLNKTAVLVCALALSACASTPNNEAGVIRDVAADSSTSTAPVAEKSFPEPDKTYVKAVQRYDASQINRLGIGLNKNQVRFIMGNPHFSEGLFFVKTWNYLVGLQKPNSNEYQVCQLRVDFDKQYLVEALTWKDPACAELLKAPPATIITQSSPVAVKTYVSNDVLFNFNRSGITDVVGGAAVVEKLGSDIRSQFNNIQQVSVIGYADRIGKVDSNAALSQARARTIADALISQGFAADKVQAGGQGATSAFGSCTGAANAQVIRCLQPNRRVVVTVTGY